MPGEGGFDSHALPPLESIAYSLASDSRPKLLVCAGGLPSLTFAW